MVDLGPQGDRPHYTCPFCGEVSFHPRDIRETYCGRCHVFACDVLEELRAGVSIGGSHTALAQPTAVRAFEALMIKSDPNDTILRMPRDIAQAAIKAIEKVIKR